MLYTLVIAIGTFLYALCAVAIPWSSDEDTGLNRDLLVQRFFSSLKMNVEKSHIEKETQGIQIPSILDDFVWVIFALRASWMFV
jgi:hypothetical protein